MKVNIFSMFKTDRPPLQIYICDDMIQKIAKTKSINFGELRKHSGQCDVCLRGIKGALAEIVTTIETHPIITSFLGWLKEN